MQALRVELGGRSYPIYIGEGLLRLLGGWVAPLAPTQCLVVTNSTVAALYAEQVERVLALIAPVARCVLPEGEAYKEWTSVAQIINVLAARGADRNSVVVALGGGVIGDIAGFAAAVFMRGIRVVQVPTTLLAQVDSSVGGKTGINWKAGKNLVGAFHQPSLVVADTDALRTLPAREVSAGLAEILKHGLLANTDYFAQVERDLPRLRALDAEALTSAIAGSCAIKAGVVGRDERESGERALLNLGHTFGHAIEALTGFGARLHGEAVGCGLCLAADLSRRLGLLGDAEVARIEAAVALAGLPTRIEGLSAAEAMASMRGDKKAESGQARFIVLERIGRAVQRTVPDALVEATLAAGGYRE
jgi:3-dehydroquinate synthase